MDLHYLSSLRGFFCTSRIPFSRGESATEPHSLSINIRPRVTYETRHKAVALQPGKHSGMVRRAHCPSEAEMSCFEKQIKRKEEMGDVLAVFDRSNEPRQTLTEHHHIPSQ